MSGVREQQRVGADHDSVHGQQVGRCRTRARRRVRGQRLSAVIDHDAEPFAAIRAEVNRPVRPDRDAREPVYADGSVTDPASVDAAGRSTAGVGNVERTRCVERQPTRRAERCTQRVGVIVTSRRAGPSEELELPGGRTFTIGTDEPDTLLAAIERARARRAPAAA